MIDLHEKVAIGHSHLGVNATGAGQDRALDGLDHTEVGRLLHMLVIPTDADGLDLERDGSRSLGGGQGRTETFRLQQRRIDPTGDRSHRVDHLLGVIDQAVQEAGQIGSTLLVGDGLGQTQLDLERHDLLLSPIVQIPLQPMPLRIVGRHQPAPGGP